MATSDETTIHFKMIESQPLIWGVITVEIERA